MPPAGMRLARIFPVLFISKMFHISVEEHLNILFMRVTSSDFEARTAARMLHQKE